MRRLWLILLLAFVAHAPSLGNDFALDDRFVARPHYDTGAPNPLIARLQPIGEYFGSPYWRGVDRVDRLYRPTAVWSYALVHHLVGRHLGGREAMPQHVVNLALFLLAVWLVWRLATALGCDGTGRFAGTAVFAVHAIHVESVASVTGRAELLAFVGGLLFVLLGRRARDAAGRMRAPWSLAAMLALFAGISSKESGLSFVPLAILVWTVTDQRRDDAAPWIRALGRSALATLMLAGPPVAFYVWLRQGALAALPAGYVVPWMMNPLTESSVGERLPNAVMIQGYGLWKLLAPFHLACDYGANVFRLATSWLDLRVIAAAVALLAPVLLAARAARRDPRPLLALLTLLGLGFVTSNVPFVVGTQFAERLWFAPSLGVSLLIAALWPRIGARWLPFAGGALALWCTASAVVAFTRSFAWRDDATLYATDAATQPKSLFIQINAAAVAGRNGDQVAREAHLRAAIAAAPDYGPAWGDLGVLLQTRNELASAEDALRRGLACKRLDPVKEAPVLQQNLALVLLGRNRGEEALALLAAALPHAAAAITQRLALVYPYLRAQVAGERLLAFLVAGQRHAAEVHWRVLEGVQLEHLGRHQAAIDVLTNLPAGPCDPAVVVTAQLQLARAFAGAGRAPDAVALCRTLEADGKIAATVREEARALRATIER